MLRKIFYNADIDYLRPGWRVTIFLMIATGFNAVITGPIVALAKQLSGIPMQTAAAFVFYATTTLATWVMLRFVDQRPFYSIGLTFKAHARKELGQGILLGSGMMTVIFVIESAAGIVTIEFRDISLQQGLLVFLNSFLLYAVVGYGEEFLFRGYLFQSFVEGTNKIVATLTMSLIFAVAHSNNPNVSMFALINIALAGIWLSVGYFKTGALWLPIGLHFSWNFFQGFVYSYPVSGTTSVNEQIGRAIVDGPVWLTGGSFGPEGGVLATLMLVLGTAIIYKWNWITAADGLWSYTSWAEERSHNVISQTAPPTPAEP